MTHEADLISEEESHSILDAPEEEIERQRIHLLNFLETATPKQRFSLQYCGSAFCWVLIREDGVPHFFYRAAVKNLLEKHLFNRRLIQIMAEPQLHTNPKNKQLTARFTVSGKERVCKLFAVHEDDLRGGLGAAGKQIRTAADRILQYIHGDPKGLSAVVFHRDQADEADAFALLHGQERARMAQALAHCGVTVDFLTPDTVQLTFLVEEIIVQ